MFHFVEFLPTLVAQAAPEGAPGCGGGNLLVFPLMFGVIYFMLIRPQQKQQKEHRSLLSGLKKGDEVVTQGGMVGKVHAVTDQLVTLEVAREVRIRILKNQISGAYVEGEATASSATGATEQK